MIMQYIFLLFLLCMNVAHAHSDDIDYDTYFMSDETIADPLEEINRIVFNFNIRIDNNVLQPIASGYSTVDNSLLSQGIKHFSNNLQEPSNLINSVLLGEFDIAINSFWRFFINSTFGIFGLFDIAELLGIPHTRKSFEDTMKYYGVTSGPYLILPFATPSSLRGLVAGTFEMITNPLLYMVNNILLFFTIKLTLSIPQRAEFLNVDLDSGIDPYVRWRSIFFQHNQWSDNENF